MEREKTKNMFSLKKVKRKFQGKHTLVQLHSWRIDEIIVICLKNKLDGSVRKMATPLYAFFRNMASSKHGSLTIVELKKTSSVDQFEKWQLKYMPSSKLDKSENENER